MKIGFLLLFGFYSISLVFSQNIEEITLLYQDEVELWLKQIDIHIEAKIKRYNDIGLFVKPYVHPKYPEPKYFGRGGSVIECFAVGRFLTTPEREGIYMKAYSNIPQEAKQSFTPFETYENFKNSLIFNPNVLFGNPANDALNSDFDGEFAYLIFYFGSYYRWPDDVFDLQLSQLENGIDKGILIFPYSFYYALFKINSLDEVELVSFYGIN